MLSKWLGKLEYKLRRVGIDNLMIYVTGTMLAVYLVENLTRVPVSAYLALSRGHVFSGEVWRLLTFLFVPPPANTFIFWVLLELYFYYWIGSSLERAWGRTRFTIFYAVGVLGAITAAMITGYATNRYLNLSLFLAFAALDPEMEIRLWLMIPVKVKWLAWIDLGLLVISFIVNDWGGRAAIIASLINLLLFFGDDFIGRIRDYRKYGRRRRDFRKQMRNDWNMYGGH